MKLLVILTLLIAGVYTRQTIFKAAVKNVNETYSLIDNNKEWLDDGGEKIQAQGGCIIKSGGTYHWFGMAFPIWRAVNHYTSTNLHNWHKETPALLPGMPGVPFGAKEWVGRPYVVYNPNNRLYIMMVEWAGGSSAVRNRYCFLSAATLQGPWVFHKEKTILQLPDSSGRQYNLGDLGVFADGKTAYLLYTFDKPRANYAQAILKLDKDFMTPLKPETANYKEFSGGKWPAGVQEAASMFKRGKYYYYFTSLCKGWFSSPAHFRTSTSVTGTGSNWSESEVISTLPLSENSFNTQHDFVLPIQGATDTTFMYCGDRWNNMQPEVGGTGQNQWFPLSFDRSAIPLPVINAPGFAVNGGDWLINLKTGGWKAAAN